MKLDKGATGGRFIYFSGTAVLEISATSVKVSGSTDLGEAIIISGKFNFDDQKFHRIAYSFSQKTGAAILFVDGKEMGKLAGLKGKQKDGGNAGFNVGSPFGNAFPGLIDNVKFLKWSVIASEISGL